MKLSINEGDLDRTFNLPVFFPNKEVLQAYIWMYNVRMYTNFMPIFQKTNERILSALEIYCV